MGSEAEGRVGMVRVGEGWMTEKGDGGLGAGGVTVEQGTAEVGGSVGWVATD